MGMVYEYDDADRKALNLSSHDDSTDDQPTGELGPGLEWWAQCFPQHTKRNTAQ